MGGTITQDQATQLQFTVGSETWFIDPNVLVFTANGPAVSSDQDQSTLINQGNIYCFGNSLRIGVRFSGTNGSIINTSGALIKGQIDGVDITDGFGNSLSNHGKIIGVQTGGVFLLITANINNFGEIFGGLAGVACQNAGATVITNSGLIHSDQHGIQLIGGNPGLPVTIFNNAGGTIQGLVAAIATLNDGFIVLTNRGTLDGGIDCNASVGDVDDVVVNKGKIIGEVHLGPGDDSFNGKGGTSGAIFGEDGDDKLTGGNGKDTITGGTGLDTITGGKGADKFVFALSIEGGDKITDFSHLGHDKIDLHLMDADPFTGGDQAFKFIGKQHFHDQEGELRAVKQGNALIVSGDINGDGITDFQIEVHGLASLVKGDFIL